MVEQQSLEQQKSQADSQLIAAFQTEEAKQRLKRLPFKPDTESLFASESVLEYQNKALATLLRSQKHKIAELTAKLEQGASEKTSLESNLAILSVKLINTSKSLDLLLAEHFTEAEPALPLSALLSESFTAENAQHSLYESLRSLLLGQECKTMPSGDGDAIMTDQSKEKNGEQKSSATHLVAAIGGSFDQAMAKVIAAHNIVTATRKQSHDEEQKDLLSTKPLRLNSVQAEKVTRLEIQLTETQAKLVQAQSMLASPASRARSKTNCAQNAGLSYSELLASLKRAETELSRLQLRFLNRPVPYYRVVGEFFSKKLGNFVEPDHVCECNLCCIDMEAAKSKAVEEALSKWQLQGAQADLDPTRAEPKSSSADLAQGDQPTSQDRTKSGAAALAAGHANQELFEQIEELKVELATRDQSFKSLQAKFERVQGSSKALLTEDALFNSASMLSVMQQVEALVDELGKRENFEHNSTELQQKLLAALADKKHLHGSLVAATGDFKAEVEKLRAQCDTLRLEMGRPRETLTGQDAVQRLQQDVASLRKRNENIDQISQKRASDLKKEIDKSRELNGRLAKAEERVKELQRKYEESKKGYLRVRDDRERLKKQLEPGLDAAPVKSATAISSEEVSISAKADQTMTHRAQDTTVSGNAVLGVSGAAQKPGYSTAELQAKYEQLKTKLRISEEAVKSAEKRATQVEEEVKAKNEQLEELYAQIDSMQECIDQLEADRSEQESLTGRLQAQQQELQRNNMDLQMQNQKLEQEQVSLDAFKTAVDQNQERIEQLLTTQQAELDLKRQVVASLERQAGLQSEIVLALQNELKGAQMSQAQASSRLQVSEAAYAKLEHQLAEAKKESEQMRAQLKSRAQAHGELSLTGMDLEIACMKYQLWKPKMTCGSCTDNGNDVEVFLPCGHMLCHMCLAQQKKIRPRACPFDRQRFVDSEIKKIYWASDQ